MTDILAAGSHDAHAEDSRPETPTALLIATQGR
jgi:hypothetical protein